MDWEAMRNEYIQGGITYRQLAAKYGVPLRTLGQHAKDEKWVEMKQQASDKAATMAVEAAARAKADMAEKIYSAAGLMLDKVIDSAKSVKTAKDIRMLTAAIKDIRDIAGVQSEADKQEQEARIMALRAKADTASGNDDDMGVTVKLIGEVVDYVQ